MPKTYEVSCRFADSTCWRNSEYTLTTSANDALMGFVFMAGGKKLRCNINLRKKIVTLCRRGRNPYGTYKLVRDKKGVLVTANQFRHLAGWQTADGIPLGGRWGSAEIKLVLTPQKG